MEQSDEGLALFLVRVIELCVFPSPEFSPGVPMSMLPFEVTRLLTFVW